MTPLSRWKRCVLAGMIPLVGFLIARPWQQVRSAEPPQGPAPAKFRYLGSGTCASCHYVTKDNPRTRYEDSKKFIKLNESETWEKEDKHSIAYDQLSSDRGKKMAKLLKVTVTERASGCLGCHSASPEEITDRQGDQYKPSEGVSCENCHAPSSGWFTPHFEKAFRTQSLEEWAKVGFTDLRKPAAQAEKCLSCHIGNVVEGKVVTHEMYAAGHPPLPSIEVATFCNSIPRHWFLQAERSDAGVRKSLGYVDGQLEQTKLAFVGAAVALKTSLKLIAEEASNRPSTGVPGQEWPDYARFDCWSCHHDLKRDGWRQARGFKDGPPGRVPVGEWPKVLVEVGIDHLARLDPANQVLRADLQRHEAALRAEANARPFGRKAPMGKAAGEFASWADVLIEKLGATTFDKPSTAKLLRKLVEKSIEIAPEYDSARHVGWTIKLLVEELGEALPNRSQAQAVIAKLEAGLNLDLPAGRNYHIEEQLGGALQVIGDYEPATFKTHLEELLPLLPPG